MSTKIVITGGPGTGKTTLMSELAAIFSDAEFIEEPAAAVIRGLGSTAIVSRPEEFCRRCIDYLLEAESQASRESSLIIQDRSLIDTLAYARRDHCIDKLPDLQNQIAEAGYAGVMVCDIIGQYAQSDTRYEDQELAIVTHGLIIDAYKEVGLPMVVLPSVPLETRAALAVAAIYEFLR